jgi:polysaccharide biosynthesis transport protein
MSREMQLRASSAMPGVPGDLFAGKGAMPPAAVAGSNGNGQPSPVQKVHRLLRGRYGLAITLALAGATLGAMVGWFSQTPEMRSEGLIQIEPVIRTIATSDKTLPFYTQFMQTQPGVIMSPRVLQRAVENPEWKALNLPIDGTSTTTLRRGLEAANLRQTQLIRVAYTHERGDVAQAGVRSVIRAYKDLVGEHQSNVLREHIQALEAEQTKLAADIRTAQANIFALAEGYGTTNLAVAHEHAQRDAWQYFSQLRQAEMLLQQANDLVGGKTGATTRPAPTVEEIAAQDPTVRAFLQRRLEQQFRIEQLASRFGPEHQSMKDAKRDLELVEKYLDQMVEVYRKNYSAPWMFLNGQQVQLTPAKLAELNADVERFTRLHEQTDKLQKEIGGVATQISKEQQQIANKTKELEKIERVLEEKLAEASTTGRIVVVNEGDLPNPASDKRKQMAFVGFLGGGSLPIAILLLVGLLQNSYRYSEEATTDLSGVPLLGILPNLPDRLTDPEQAATAAHCVHQIRTMLQINGGDDRQVYCVTSAGPGDGKTSLTLALGLSFAASGSRTLLIDCDLVGAGLTARLDMAGPEGILEAMSNRTLLEYVRQTDIADLAMLPVGQAQAHHAGLFSPAALRRLVAEARKHFEIVLIDTGPILGSIEATPVCSASDAVILTVARGQQRPLVEKALGHLLAIGSRFAGVVFNRAQARDFETSISGMSIRSIARATGATAGNSNGAAAAAAAATARGGFRKAEPQPKTFGPVARAVAGSFKPTDDGGRK